ncbi:MULTISPECIES: type II toxin-antitoxin system VapC family toxin [Methylobacterium]|uniref:type II toxin-antitoxin system VapC family toxin n=1 Tax=Methylobacterium TaxID=407 RepID=UPI0011C88088|nr:MULTISPECIES: type II toxin-antitoxin system VapC family toxin [Methylobacterium]TXN21349.1 type II toxin-antitoxin system VapC family toxin [Methylobacterium sp. WL9]
MVVDSSAVVAISFAEPDAAAFSAVLAKPDRFAISAGTYLECSIVLLSRFGSITDFDRWLTDRSIEVVSVDQRMAQIAADAFVRFGKGRHPAGLNFGDCFSYALAKRLNAPLLFKGNDFSKTDVASALP